MHRTLPALTRAALLTAAGCLLSACAVYHASPLGAGDDHPTLPASSTRVEVDAHALGLPPLPAHRFAAAQGLDMTDIATLAVLNNPDLKLARSDLAIAKAQAFDAGLLPDPQLTAIQDWTRPHISGASSDYTAGLSIDVMKIITRGANKAAADATVRKTDLGMLWQEWQLVAQARILFLKAQLQDTTVPLLTRQRDLNLARLQAMSQGARQRDITGDALGVAQLAYQDSQTALADAQRAASQTRHDLNALLGLAPDVQLKLLPREPLGDAAFAQAIAASIALTHQDLGQLASRRPDLLALKQGYLAQENKYRAAVLNQFPTFQFGVQQARDTSYVKTQGYTLTLSLPVFNRNRGVIAIEKATRERLHVEYFNRVNSAYADVDRLRADIQLLAAQVDTLQHALPDLDSLAAATERAYALHAVTIGTYTDTQNSLLARDIAVATTQEALAEQRVALQALMGADIPQPYASKHLAVGVTAP
ncbi:TolC family protein [Pseudomonas sp. App30]|uniref:TolC family protein n=1 Tax=Pseudomonas sp. App30 TaxID=3068990 RepID=UPI003A80C18E